jgi:cytoskeletal protein CcmA (bactofilin family)
MEDVQPLKTLSPVTGGLEEEGYQMYLGQGCRLTGVLKVQGMMRIDGFVEGEVFGSDLIQVGQEGTIEATVRAKHIVAQGPLRGDIAAQEKVELLAPAKVEGTIDSPVFLLEEGVFVNGTLKMAAMNPPIQ